MLNIAFILLPNHLFILYLHRYFKLLIMVTNDFFQIYALVESADLYNVCETCALCSNCGEYFCPCPAPSGFHFQLK